MNTISLNTSTLTYLYIKPYCQWVLNLPQTVIYLHKYITFWLIADKQLLVAQNLFAIVPE